MEKLIIVSVIVPVYKVEKYLHTCIESVIKQSYPYWELILVDDGSPDKCPAICDEYAVKDRRIRVIHKQNGGLSSARNVALAVAKGEYVTFLDSDDYWHHDYLKVLLNLCVEHHADIAQCSYIRGIAVLFPDRNKSCKINIYDNYSIFLKEAAKIIVWGKLYKLALFDGIRMAEGKINEDDFTTWKLYYKAQKIILTSYPLYYYTYNPASIMSVQKKHPRLDFMEAYEERIAFFIDRKIKELELFSRKHYCKALLLTCRNNYLSIEQRTKVEEAFYSNWQIIKQSSFVSPVLKSLFYLFTIAPKTTICLLGLLKK